MQKEVRERIGLVLALSILLLLALNLKFVLALNCVVDEDCSSLTGDWTCDTNSFECVQLDFSDVTSSSSDTNTVDSSSDTTLTDTSSSDLSATDSNSGETLTQETSTTETTSETTEDNISEETITSTNSDTTELESRLNTVESKVDELTGAITTLTETVDDLNTNVQLLSTDQHQLERNVEEKVNIIEASVATGLAGLQEDIEITQSDIASTREEVKSASRASFFRSLATIVILIVIFAALGFFLKIHSKHENKSISKEVKDYITSQIQKGVSRKEIVSALVSNGWPEHDANWAFEQTSVANYNNFLAKHGRQTVEMPKRKLDKDKYQKIVIVSVLSIFMIGAMLFILNNPSSTGQAIYYDGITDSDLADLVLEKLELKIEDNSFYSLIDYAEICVQVNDANASASFRVLKTPYGHSIDQVEVNCNVESLDYDFAVSFTSYDSFNSLASLLTCSNMQAIHAIQPGTVATRGVYVLPSYFVGSGFEVISSRDYSDYCSALSLCLSESDMDILGIDC